MFWSLLVPWAMGLSVGYSQRFCPIGSPQHCTDVSNAFLKADRLPCCVPKADSYRRGQRRDLQADADQIGGRLVKCALEAAQRRSGVV